MNVQGSTIGGKSALRFAKNCRIETFPLTRKATFYTPVPSPNANEPSPFCFAEATVNGGARADIYYEMVDDLFPARMASLKAPEL